jgi:hypothetical protein
MPPQASSPQPSGSQPPALQSPAQTQQPPPTQQLHPEIRSVVQLNHAHAHKVYISGPLVRKLEFTPDGQKPIKDEGWTEIWAQLGGTTLSVWDMKEIEAASKQGKEVPPSYINVTDAVRISFFTSFPCTYFSSAHPDRGIANSTRHAYDSCETVSKRFEHQHRRRKPLPLLMQNRPRSHVLGRCASFGFLGKIQAR